MDINHVGTGGACQGKVMNSLSRDAVLPERLTEQTRLIGARWPRLLLGIGLCGFLSAAIASSPAEDPNHPPHQGADYYPAESMRLHEEGTCKVRMMVAADGTIRNISLTQSSGYPRLDEACLNAFVDGGMLPAVVDGKPIDAWTEMPIAWSLSAEKVPQKQQPKLDLNNLPHIGNAYYPPISRRLNEQGICIVTLTVTAKKEIHDIRLTESSGYPRLDKACLEAFAHGGLLPATVDGKPIDSTAGVSPLFGL